MQSTSRPSPTDLRCTRCQYSLVALKNRVSTEHVKNNTMSQGGCEVTWWLQKGMLDLLQLRILPEDVSGRADQSSRVVLCDLSSGFGRYHRNQTCLHVLTVNCCISTHRHPLPPHHRYSRHLCWLHQRKLHPQLHGKRFRSASQRREPFLHNCSREDNKRVSYVSFGFLNVNEESVLQ